MHVSSGAPTRKVTSQSRKSALTSARFVHTSSLLSFAYLEPHLDG